MRIIEWDVVMWRYQKICHHTTQRGIRSFTKWDSNQLTVDKEMNSLRIPQLSAMCAHPVCSSWDIKYIFFF
jgi:hypothetical protein